MRHWAAVAAFARDLVRRGRVLPRLIRPDKMRPAPAAHGGERPTTGSTKNGNTKAGNTAAGSDADGMSMWAVAPDDARAGWRPVLTGADAAYFRELLGNVFRHTPEGTAFGVTLHEGRDAIGILVADAGPGIADPETALERGASGSGSTGLGLDIARRLAESTGGVLRLDRSPMGGAEVQVWLRTAAHTEKLSKSALKEA
ncbi:ATP-binding protein [Nonomuraea fuscirosea]